MIVTSGGSGNPVYPLPGQVLANVAFGNNGASTGTVVLPDVAVVRSTKSFGPANQLTGTLTLPDASHVLDGVAFGGNGNELTGTLVLSAVKDYDVDIKTVSLNKYTFYSAGREILSAQITAVGDDVPSGLLDTPIYLVVDPTLGTVPPTPNSTNSCLAHMRTLNGNVYAQIYIGNTQGGQVLPELPLAGSSAGTPYKLWLLINSVNGEVLWVPSDTFKVY